MKKAASSSMIPPNILRFPYTITIAIAITITTMIAILTVYGYWATKVQLRQKVDRLPDFDLEDRRMSQWVAMLGRGPGCMFYIVPFIGVKRTLRRNMSFRCFYFPYWV